MTNNDKALAAYNRGQQDGKENLGRHADEYKGHAQKCYLAGFIAGKLDRAFTKKAES